MATNWKGTAPTAPNYDEIEILETHSNPYPPPYSANPPNPTPIVAQPTTVIEPNNWMYIPLGVDNCTPGLEYLTSIDQLLVKRKDSSMKGKFVVKNTIGQNVFWAIELSDSCVRDWCGSRRSFEIKIFDIYNKEVIHLSHPFQCASETLEVSSPPGQPVGRIDDESTFFLPHFSVENHNGETVLRIEGPLNRVACGRDIEFKILKLDGTEVGKISKKWSGLLREIFSDSDNFGISFPMDLDVRMKAVLLGACILIDVMFYDDN